MNKRTYLTLFVVGALLGMVKVILVFGATPTNIGWGALGIAIFAGFIALRWHAIFPEKQ